MSEYVITTDNNSDLPEKYLKDHGVGCMYLSYSMDGKNYTHGNFLPEHEFYEAMRNGSMPTTAQVNPENAKALLEPYLKEGKDILHLSFSSGLSGTYNSMCIAAEELQEKYPERKIVVIDTLCASLGEGLIDYKALELQKEGKSLEEVAQWVEENKLKICHFFMVEDLNHLQKGGRISKTAAVLGTMVQIKPIIYLDNEGKLQIIKKERGRKKALTHIVDMAVKQSEGWDNDIVMITHGDCKEDAEFVARQVEKKMGIHNILINCIGTVIGSHTGPGVVAVFCMGNKR